MFTQMLLVKFNKLLQRIVTHDVCIQDHKCVWISHGYLVTKVIQTTRSTKRLELL